MFRAELVTEGLKCFLLLRYGPQSLRVSGTVLMNWHFQELSEACGCEILDPHDSCWNSGIGHASLAGV